MSKLIGALRVLVAEKMIDWALVVMPKKSGSTKIWAKHIGNAANELLVREASRD